ncbi:hypothetical protein ACJX0J_030653, partial [Zea mays]
KKTSFLMFTHPRNEMDYSLHFGIFSGIRDMKCPNILYYLYVNAPVFCCIQKIIFYGSIIGSKE